MQILILEGIATCGKSSLTKSIEELALKQGQSVLAMDEEETMWPLRNTTSQEECISFLKNILDKVLGEEYDLVIFDRFHFSQIFRTKGTVDDFMEIEDMLRPFAQVIFLKVKESTIPQRIRDTMARRPASWAEYVRKKGTDEEIDAYYIGQQRMLEGVCKETTLPVVEYDTTDMHFDDIARQVLAH